MITSIRSVDIIFQKAIYLQKKGIPFVLTGTNGAYKLESEYYKDEVYISKFKQGLLPKDLGFIKRIKNHIIKEQIYLKYTEFLNPGLIKYVETKEYPEGTLFNDVYEVDLDEAYWKTALNEGIISKELYDEGCKFKFENLDKEETAYKKKVRLIALGSLAKQKSYYEFSGKKIIRRDPIKSVLTENVWYTIVKKVSDIMTSAQKIAGNDFLMFWVDGIYIKGHENVEKIQDYFHSKGYESKVKKIHKFYYKNRIIHSQDTELENKEDIRTFNLPALNKKRKKTLFSNLELIETAKKYSK